VNDNDVKEWLLFLNDIKFVEMLEIAPNYGDGIITDGEGGQTWREAIF
jgi:hypothetical protein